MIAKESANIHALAVHERFAGKTNQMRDAFLFGGEYRRSQDTLIGHLQRQIRDLATQIQHFESFAAGNGITQRIIESASIGLAIV